LNAGDHAPGPSRSPRADHGPAVRWNTHSLRSSSLSAQLLYPSFASCPGTSAFYYSLSQVSHTATSLHWLRNSMAVHTKGRKRSSASTVVKKSTTGRKWTLGMAQICCPVPPGMTQLSHGCRMQPDWRIRSQSMLPTRKNLFLTFGASRNISSDFSDFSSIASQLR
jgi:hypothetical protein